MPQITRTKLGAANFGPWENIVRVLILVWFMLYTLNAIPDIHPLVGRIAAKVNYWISYFFMFEYILRVLCAKPRKAYIFSGMGILDFIVCVPFLGMFFGTDWQILYSLRIVRILAIFKLARFNETAASFKKAFYLIRDEFFLFFSVILFMLYVTSLGIYIAEHDALVCRGNVEYGRVRRPSAYYAHGAYFYRGDYVYCRVHHCYFHRADHVCFFPRMAAGECFCAPS